MDTTLETTPGRVAKHYLDTFFQKDIEKTLDCLTDDVAWNVQGAPGVPTVGIRHGKAQVREWLGIFPAHFVPLEIFIERIFEDGNQAVVTGKFSHRIISTNRKFKSSFAAIFTIKDGKICEYNFLEDSFALWNSFQMQ